MEENGTISKWNLDSGKRIRSYDIKQGLRFFQCAASDDNCDYVYGLDQLSGRKLLVKGLGEEEDKTEAKTLFTLDVPITDMQVFQNGLIIAMISSKNLIVGKGLNPQASPQEQEYEWQKIEFPEGLSCLAVRGPDSVSGTSPLSVAVGGLDGSIHFYENLTSNLQNKSSKGKHASHKLRPGEKTPSTKLHWHRKAVGALAWSKDGMHRVRWDTWKLIRQEIISYLALRRRRWSYGSSIQIKGNFCLVLRLPLLE